MNTIDVSFCECTYKVRCPFCEKVVLDSDPTKFFIMRPCTHLKFMWSENADTGKPTSFNNTKLLQRELLIRSNYVDETQALLDMAKHNKMHVDYYEEWAYQGMYFVYKKSIKRKIITKQTT